MCPMCQRPDDPAQCCPPRPRRRMGVFSFLFQLCLLYLVLVFGGGTLINTGHPVAVELGRLIHVVTFVEPGIQWAQGNDHPILASSLKTVAGGIPLG